MDAIFYSANIEKSCIFKRKYYPINRFLASNAIKQVDKYDDWWRYNEINDIYDDTDDPIMTSQRQIKCEIITEHV